MPSDTQSMIDAIKGGIDNNSTDAPAMSIDPKSQQVSVVGDPTKIKETKGEYSITFVYPADVLAEEDKAKMRKNDDGEYETTIKYFDRRAKPLHRTKIAMYVANILSVAGIILEDGSYTTDTITEKTAESFLKNIDNIADIAKMILDIPDDQIQFINSNSLIYFFIQMLDNEPNIVKESASFLEPSLIKRLQRQMEQSEQKENKRPNTRRS